MSAAESQWHLYTILQKQTECHIVLLKFAKNKYEYTTAIAQYEIDFQLFHFRVENDEWKCKSQFEPTRRLD